MRLDDQGSQLRYPASAWLIAMVVWSHSTLALDPSKAFHHYRLDVWQTEDGLPLGSVVKILQTSDGYLWLGGYEDLGRFDGLRFTVVEKLNTPAVPGNNVYGLEEGPDGSLWIGTDGGGLTRVEDGGHTTYTTREGMVDDQVTSLCTGRDGALWIGTMDGLSRLQDGRFVSYTTREGLPHNQVMAVVEDRHGSLWIGTPKGLGRLQGGVWTTFTEEDGLPSSWISTLLEDRDGNLWIGTMDGTLSRFRDETFITYPGEAFSGKDLVTLLEDRDGNLWIGTWGVGLCRLRDERITCFGRRDGLSSDVVSTLFEDREGSLWLGTEGGGLNRVRDQRFTPFTTREGLPHERVWVVSEDRDGDLWIGTDGGGLARLSHGEITTYTTREGLASDYINALHPGRDGSLWIGTDHGLDRWREGRIGSEPSGRIDPSTVVLALSEDHRGNLWIGTESEGLFRLRDGELTVYTTAGGLPEGSVRALHVDRRGVLWIGTDGGLATLEEGKIAAYVAAASTTFVRVIYEDAQGTLWVGTRGHGLLRIGDGELTSYTTREGLANDVVYHLLEDSRQNFWMSCNQGIFRVSRKELDDLAHGAVSSVRSVAYGRTDGMKSIECGGGSQPAGARTRDGRLWFPTLQGLVIIDPEDLKLNELPPPVHIERVIRDDVPVDHAALAAGGRLTLPPGTRELEFHYTALSLRDPRKVRFKYRLTGYDDQWVDAGTRRAAYYTNMLPGSYRFQVIASNDDGVWNETGDRVELYLRPAFYQTGTFYLLGAVALALLIWGGHRLRMQRLLRHNRELRDLQKQLEARNAEMERFTYTVSHDLKSPLFTIEGFLGMLDKDAAMGDTKRVKEDMARIRTATGKMRQLLDELLELSRIGRVVHRPQEVSLGVLAREAVGLVSGQIDIGQVEVVILPDLPVFFGDRARLLEVLQNLLDNAVKYMGSQPRPQVEIGARREKQGTVCYVRDNGMGIDPRDHEKVFGLFERLDTSTSGSGLGLALVQRIIEVHGGRLWLESEGEGRGCTFFFHLPDEGVIDQPVLASRLDGS